MAGAAITIRHDDHLLQEQLNLIEKRLIDHTPVHKIIGEIVTASVQRNFEQGGRPEKWAPLSPATLKKKKSDKTLVEQGFAGGLLGSIHYKADQSSTAVGTDKIYAALQHFGGKVKRAARSELFVRNRISRGPRKGKFKKGTTAGRGFTFGASEGEIPARPFLLVQDKDRGEIVAAVADFIIKGRV